MYSLVIIDDAKYTIEGISKLLDWKMLGIEIVGTALDGDDGLQLIRQKNPDIVLTDIKMRSMDGIEMTEILRAEGYKGKIIMLSGYREFEYARRAIDVGAYKYLLKPIDETELQKTIESIVGEWDENDARNSLEIKKGKARSVIERILEYIDENYMDDVSLETLARISYSSKSHISRLFKEYTGVNLIECELSIDEIVYKVGYKDGKHFRKIFKKMEGVSPREYKYRCLNNAEE